MCFSSGSLGSILFYAFWDRAHFKKGLYIIYTRILCRAQIDKRGNRLQNIITLSNINDSDIQKVGQRAVDLNKMYKAKAEIPLSFVVPNLIFEEFSLQNRLILQIRNITDKLTGSDEEYESAHLKIRNLFEQSTIPEEFKEELLESYHALSSYDITNAQALLKDEEPVVNLIISPDYSITSEKFTGILLNICGVNEFFNGLKSCWLALYSPEHLKLRFNKKIVDFNTGIIVQKFLQPDCTAEAYSKSIIGNYEIPIHAYFGLPDITYSFDKDFYSVSRETFGIAKQEVKNQSHILLKNNNSGTLIKRSLGRKGLTQKLLDKQIFEIARYIEKLSFISQIHFRILFFIEKEKIFIFLVDKTGERTAESEQFPKSNTIEDSTQKTSKTNNSIKSVSLQDLSQSDIKIIPVKTESIADLLNAPIDHKDDLHEEEFDTIKVPLKVQTQSDAFGWETTIDSDTSKVKKTETVKAIILDKPTDELVIGITTPIFEEKKEELPKLNEQIIILDDSDDFIFSSKKETQIEKAKLEESKQISIEEAHIKEEIANIETKNNSKDEIIDNKSQIKEEILNNNLIGETAISQKKELNPDYEFFMSIILDLEPALDQEILTKYQQKFSKVPTDVNLALNELTESDFPEKEQVFKLKNMKDLLERGEKINLQVFLDITERLRKIV